MRRIALLAVTKSRAMGQVEIHESAATTRYCCRPVTRSRMRAGLGLLLALEAVVAGPIAFWLAMVVVSRAFGIENYGGWGGQTIEATSAARAYTVVGFLVGGAAWIAFTVLLRHYWRRANSNRTLLLLALSPVAFVALVTLVAVIASVAIGPQASGSRSINP